MFSRVLQSGVVFATLCLFGIGCATPTTHTERTPRLLPRISDVPTIGRSTSFAEITTAYRAGDYKQALSQVQMLSQKTDLSPADRLFLQRQQEIIQKAISGSTAMAKPAMVVSPTSSASLADCGPRALHFVCQELGVPASLSALTRVAGTRPGVGSNLAGLTHAANSVGLTARGVQVDADALRRVPTPALAWVDGNHFVAVTQIKDDFATVHDPNKIEKEEVALDRLLQRSGGILLLLEKGKKNSAKIN